MTILSWRGRGTAVQGGDPGEYDPEEYYRLVVRDLRHRPDQLPADLFVRYALPYALGDRSATWLAAHLDAVLADWAARVEPTREGAVYSALLAAHEALAADPDADLADPAWWIGHRTAPEAVPAGPSVPDPSVPDPPAQLLRNAPLPRAGPVAVQPIVRGGADPVRADPVRADPAHAAAQLRPSARRVGDQAELRWTWPTWAAVTDVVVDGRRQRVSRHAYRQHGRWRLAVDAEQVEVELIVRGSAGETLCGRVTVPLRRQEVRYAVRRLGWWRGRRFRFSFAPVTMPPPYCRVTVGYSTSRVMPGGVDDLVTDGGSTAIYGPCQTDLRVPRGARWVGCFLIEGADAVELVEPDVAQLRVR